MKALAKYIWIVSLAATLGFPAVSTAEETRPVGKVVLIEGSAVVVQPGKASGIPLEEGSPVYTGDLIQTFAKSKVKILFQDDSVVVVGPQSQFQIDEHMFSAEKNERVATFKLLLGRIRVLVGRHATAAGSRFEVTTPTAVTGVRGTHFIIEVLDDNETNVFTIEGELLVDNVLGDVGGALALIAGMMTQVMGGEVPTGPVEIPADVLKDLLNDLALADSQIKLTGIEAGRLEALKELLENEDLKIQITFIPDDSGENPQADQLPFSTAEGWRAMNPWMPQAAVNVQFPGDVYGDLLWDLLQSETLQDIIGN